MNREIINLINLGSPHQMNLISLFGEINENNSEETNQTTSKDFMNSLSSIENKEENITCSLCLEEIKIGEKCIQLPCKENPHLFHIENKGCPGIMKWLEKSNTCPICRSEFPSETNNTTNNEGVIHGIDGNSLIQFINHTRERIVEQIEERQLEIALHASLEDQ